MDHFGVLACILLLDCILYLLDEVLAYLRDEGREIAVMKARGHGCILCACVDDTDRCH